MTNVDFSVQSIIFITGASRGIGRALAIEISRVAHPESALVLIASSVEGLEETKSLITNTSVNLTVLTYPLDLSYPSLELYDKLFMTVREKLNISTSCHSMFFHNAASIGVLQKTIDLTDIVQWNQFYDLNVTSAIILNTCFVQKMRNLTKKMFVINITSDNAHLPFPSMSMYSSGKAARELFFKVFAQEESDIIVLNYSPGPVDTVMFNFLKDTVEDEEMKAICNEITEKYLLQPEQTVKMLLNILETGCFKSGDYLDYFDKVFDVTY